MDYPKIQTIFKRDEKGKIIPESITKREFEVIKEWTITEKIDGTNVHVDFEKYCDDVVNDDCEKWKVTYHGKTDNAQMPVPLLNHLTKTFGEHLERYVKYFTDHDDSVKKVVIFGEGYGGSIQKGHEYSPDQKFIAFDMWIDGWWLEPLHAKSICEELEIPFVPVMTFSDIGTALMVAKMENTLTYLGGQHSLEGFVGTSKPLMLFRDGKPIKWKIKGCDYGKL